MQSGCTYQKFRDPAGLALNYMCAMLESNWTALWPTSYNQARVC